MRRLTSTNGEFLRKTTARDEMDREYWTRELEEAEVTLGFSDGYKFVYGPWKTLGTAEVAFLSLNPGKASPRHRDIIREIADERGNTFEVEQPTTVSPMNDQFLQLAQLLDRQPSDILTGVVAPFRSDNWAGLIPRQREGSLALGRRFWNQPLSRPSLRLVIACSGEATRLVTDITGASLDGEAEAGWGNIKLRRYFSPLGKVIVQLPHLSRFRLLGRERSERKLRAFLGAASRIVGGF